MFRTLKTSTEAVGLLCMIVIFVLVVIMLLLGTVIEWFKKRRLRRQKWVDLDGDDVEKEKEGLDIDEESLSLEMTASVCTVARQTISPMLELPEDHHLAPPSGWINSTAKAMLEKHDTLPLPPPRSVKVASVADPERSFSTLPPTKPSGVAIIKLLPLLPHTPPRTPIKNIFSSPLRSPYTPAFQHKTSIRRPSLPLRAMPRFQPLPLVPVRLIQEQSMAVRESQEMGLQHTGEQWMKEVGVVRRYDTPMRLQAQAQGSPYMQMQGEVSRKRPSLHPRLPLNKTEAKIQLNRPCTPLENVDSSPISLHVFSSTQQTLTRWSQTSTPFTRLQYSQTPFTPHTPYTAQTSTTPPSSAPYSSTHTAPTTTSPSSHPTRNQDLYFLPLASPTSSAWNSPTRPIFFSPSTTPPVALSPPLTHNSNQKSKHHNTDLSMKPVPPLPTLDRERSYHYAQAHWNMNMQTSIDSASGLSPLPDQAKRISSPLPPPLRTNIPRKPLPVTKHKSDRHTVCPNPKSMTKQTGQH